MRKRLFGLLAFAVIIAAPLAAQERVFSFAVHGDVETASGVIGPQSGAGLNLGIRFGNVDWGGVPMAGAGADAGDLSLGGTLRLVAPRLATDDPRYSGLGDIDRAVELGLNLAYQRRHWQAFIEARQGFDGHDGVTGTLGADLILRPSSRWTLTAGPRLELGNSNYAGTYYGVSTAQAATSGYAPYDPGGGILSAGVNFGARYRIDDRWAVEGRVSFQRLQNAAADSPITDSGSERKWRLRVGFSRAVSLRF